MRKLFYLLCILWISNNIYSQAPQAFNYQAVVRNKTGEVLKAQPLEVQIAILSDQPQGPTVYQETHTITTSDAGTISLQIGKGTPLQGKFEEIDWASGKSYFMNTAFTLNNEKITLGAVQILSVPYALYAQHSGEKHDLVLKGGVLSIDGGGAGVKLPAGGGTSGSCLWDDGGTEIYREGAISLRNKNTPYLQAYSDIDGVGHLSLNYKGDKSITFDQGEIVTYNVGEQPKVKITNTSNSENGGIGIWGGGAERISLLAPQVEGGTGSLIYMRGKDATKPMITLSATDYANLNFSTSNKMVDLNYKGLRIWDTRNTNKLIASIGSYANGDNIGTLLLRDHYNDNNKNHVYISGGGYIDLLNSKGETCVVIGSPNEEKLNIGNIGIYYNGDCKGAFQIQNGKSYLFTDEIFLNGSQLRSSTTSYSSTMKSSSDYAPCFVSESTDKQITFRGTASLINGRYKIVLPSQEAEKIIENSITIHVTPLSDSSKGLAITQKSYQSFTVTELMSGKGNYDFDWILTALVKETSQLRSSNSGPAIVDIKRMGIMSPSDSNE